MRTTFQMPIAAGFLAALVSGQAFAQPAGLKFFLGKTLTVAVEQKCDTFSPARLNVAFFNQTRRIFISKSGEIFWYFTNQDDEGFIFTLNSGTQKKPVPIKLGSSTHQVPALLNAVIESNDLFLRAEMDYRYGTAEAAGLFRKTVDNVLKLDPKGKTCSVVAAHYRQTISYGPTVHEDYLCSGPIKAKCSVSP